MPYSSDPSPFENYFVILQLLKGKDESKSMDVFLMRIMKVERQVEALEEEWNVDTDRCSAERGGNDESVMWLNDTSEKSKDCDEQCWKQTRDFSESLKSIWKD